MSRSRTRLCAGALVLASTTALAQDAVPSPAPTPSPAGRFDETVEVVQVIMEVRVVDAKGQPVRGLRPADFKATVDAQTVVPVDSLAWVDAQTANTVAADGKTLVASGRSIVFLFQKDLHGSRAAGLLQMAKRAEKMVDALPAVDRVAVASFDTGLRLWTDLTTDRARAKDAIGDGVIMNRALETEPPGGGLRAQIAPERAARAGSMEAAMQILGEAMGAIPGDRSLVLVGSYLGRSPTVVVQEGYEAAQRALSKARVAVYTLDVTDADQHTLEVGMEQVAFDTGGFYAKTRDFAGGAVTRLQGALEGHYQLAFTKPAGAPGFHEVKLELVGREGTVLARPGYAD